MASKTKMTTEDLYAKRPEVPLSVDTLNEWYENSNGEEIREWVKNNQLNVVNYKDCHKYSQDLVALIMDTFCELAENETDKEKLETPMKKLLLWLFRWRNSSTRKAEDVQSLFARIRLPLVFKDRASSDKTLQKKLFVAVRRFCQMRKVDTAGWTCEDVLELLSFAHDHEFGPLLDALVNTVTRKYLKPAYLAKIHDLASRLEFSKLQQIIVDYIKNRTMIILSSNEFTNYPSSLIELILENLKGQEMHWRLKLQVMCSLRKWRISNSVDELKAVFNRIQWEDFAQKEFGKGICVVIPLSRLGNISGPSASAECKGAKRKLSDDPQSRRRGRPRKE